MKFQRRVDTIEAIRYDGTNLEEVVTWIGAQRDWLRDHKLEATISVKDGNLVHEVSLKNITKRGWPHDRLEVGCWVVNDPREGIYALPESYLTEVWEPVSETIPIELVHLVDS